MDDSGPSYWHRQLMKKGDSFVFFASKFDPCCHDALIVRWVSFGKYPLHGQPDIFHWTTVQREPWLSIENIDAIVLASIISIQMQKKVSRIGKYFFAILHEVI